jgi:hypothetical protein
MAVARIEGDLKHYVESFENSAESVRGASVKSKLRELGRELEGLEPWIEGAWERPLWTESLDELEGALAACNKASGVGVACSPFLERADRFIHESRQIRFRV